MTTALVAFLIGLAVFDSLNPSLFVALFYLLATTRPVLRILSYIAGVLVVNFFGGLLLFFGVWETIGRLLDNLGNEVLFGVQLLAGMALVLFGFVFKATSDSAQDVTKKLRSISPVHTFLLGMAVMLNEITTALPYFAAIERIIRAQMDTIGNLLALAGYNVVFSLPLFGFLALYVAYGQRFTSEINRLTQPVIIWTLRIIKYGSIVLGIPLVLDAIVFFITGTGLFGW
jgi:cytochrome c biogenesis protein CcdA